MTIPTGYGVIDEREKVFCKHKRKELEHLLPVTNTLGVTTKDFAISLSVFPSSHIFEAIGLDKMPLHTLPTELIANVVGHLHNLDDLKALTLTSRRFSQVCLTTGSETLYEIFKISYKDPIRCYSQEPRRGSWQIGSMRNKIVGRMLWSTISSPPLMRKPTWMFQTWNQEITP